MELVKGDLLVNKTFIGGYGTKEHAYSDLISTVIHSLIPPF